MLSTSPFKRSVFGRGAMVPVIPRNLGGLLDAPQETCSQESRASGARFRALDVELVGVGAGRSRPR
jgi:hypothetical protein